MDKIVTIYASIHHNNTKKAIDYLASHFSAEMDIIDIMANKTPEISDAEWIIFASGIYFGTVHKSITNYISNTDLSGKRVLIVYTCGLKYRDFAKATGKLLAERGADYVGSCYCRGFDTFGLLGRIGGIAKGHPNDADLDKILKSLNYLVQRNAHSI